MLMGEGEMDGGDDGDKIDKISDFGDVGGMAQFKPSVPRIILLPLVRLLFFLGIRIYNV